MVVFKHGSVVLFNVEEDRQTKYLHGIMKHCGTHTIRHSVRQKDRKNEGHVSELLLLWYYDVLGEVVPQSHRFREDLECRLRPWQDKYHEMGQVNTHIEQSRAEGAGGLTCGSVYVVCVSGLDSRARAIGRYRQGNTYN